MNWISDYLQITKIKPYGELRLPNMTETDGDDKLKTLIEKPAPIKKRRFSAARIQPVRFFIIFSISLGIHLNILSF